MVVRRTIRLKEWGVFEDTYKTPSDEYMEKTDGSLLQQPYRLRTDYLGFIDNGNEISNRGSKRSLICLGGSFVESLFCEETLRFPSQLERKLVDDENLIVLNGGYSGATLLHSYNILLNKIIPLLPYCDRVLLFTAMSDNHPQTQARSYWLDQKMHAPILDPRNGNVLKPSRTRHSAHQSALLASMIELCRQFGHNPVVVLTPFRTSEYGGDNFLTNIFREEEAYRQYCSGYEQINRTAKVTAERAGVHVIDATRHFVNKPEYFYDTLHLNLAGQTFMSDLLSEKLQAVL